MKITKKIPIRQRGRTDNKRQATKDSIRDVYLNGPQKEVQIIPAKRDLIKESEKPKLRVCAYCRVSTEMEEQTSSIELQERHYSQLISANPNWESAGIFAERATGLNTKERPEFRRMIAQCRKKRIDLILTKSISRFGRNTVDMLRSLLDLNSLGVR